MRTAVIDQESGEIYVGDLRVWQGSDFRSFERDIFGHLRLIYGSGGTAKYGFDEPVHMFGEIFRIYFLFQNGSLRSCTFELVSGVADTQIDEYPSYAELQNEVIFLFKIYERELHGNLRSEYEWKKVWHYDWGKITLIQEMQNSRVITDISWS